MAMFSTVMVNIEVFNIWNNNNNNDDGVFSSSILWKSEHSCKITTLNGNVHVFYTFWKRLSLQDFAGLLSLLGSFQGERIAL